MVWGVAVQSVAAWMGASARVWRLSSKLSARWVCLPAFVLIWSVLEWLVTIPMRYYSGHVVERRYGLSTQSVRAWAADELKGLAVSVTLGVPVTSGFLYLVRRYPGRWWLIASGLILPLSIALTALYPVLVAPIFNKYEPVQDPELVARLKRLSHERGVTVSQVLRMDMSRQTKKANAFFAGLGRTRRILLADTLLESFEPREVDTVVAHELAHQVHRDTWRLAGVAAMATFTATVALDRAAKIVLPRTARRIGSSELSDPANYPLVSLLTTVLGLMGLPLLNAYVRRMERRAEGEGIGTTADPDAFIGAMRRLQRTNLVDQYPPALARLLLHSHPTIGERVRWAETHAAASQGGSRVTS